MNQVTQLPAVIAGLLVSAISSDVVLLVAIVAEHQITLGQLGIEQSSLVKVTTSLTTGVTDAFTSAIDGHMISLLQY